MRKILALVMCLVATSAMAQQAIVFNKSTVDDQFTYEIGYYANNDGATIWVSLDKETITIRAGKYQIIQFPKSTPGQASMNIYGQSAIENGRSAAKYRDVCWGGNNQENVAFTLDDMNSPLVTCTVTQYLNDI